MDETKQKIIAMFKERGEDIPTGDILMRVYPESKTFKDKEDLDSKRKTAQFHRKLLYHINELTPKYKKKMTISRPIMPSMPIENYEHQGIVLKYEPSSWIDKLNSIVIMADK